MKKVLFTSLSVAVMLAVLAAQAQAATTIAHYKFEGISGDYIDETGNNNAALGTVDLRGAGGANNMVDGGSQSLIGASQAGGTGGMQSATAGTTLPQGNAWIGHHTAEFSFLWDGGDMGFNIMAGAQGTTGAGAESKYWVANPGSDKQVGIVGRVKPPGAGIDEYISYVDLGLAQGAGIVGAASAESPTWVDIALVVKINDPTGNKAYINRVDVTGTSVHSTVDPFEDAPSSADPFGAFGIGGQAWDCCSLGAWDAWAFLGFDNFRISSGERVMAAGADQLLMYPEPATIALLALGGLMMLRRRRA